MKSAHGCVWALMLVAASVAHGQDTGPWKVVVSSTANPLRVAECSPVRADVTDAKGSARNPKGVLISLADFDLSVTAGRDGAIVGRYDGAAAWSACACAGAAGATATITASYPARSLPPELRMPGVTFQSSITVPVIAGRSSAVPIGCELVKTTTVGAGREVVPWAVTIVPSLRAVPIGNCAPVYIDLRDAATKGGPRNPKSVLVSLADFDMSVTSAQSGAVAGRVDGAAAWSVCGCQGAAVGTMATVTATYPARALADGLRVPGVAFQSSTTISLAAANGTFNPPACVSPQPNPIAPASSRVLTPPVGATTPAVATGGTAAAAGGAAAGAAAGGGAAGVAAGGAAAARGEGAGPVAGGAAAAGRPEGAGTPAAGSAAPGGAAAGGAAAGGAAAGGAAAGGAAAGGAAAGGAAAGGAAAGGAAAGGAAAGAAAAGGAASGRAATTGTVTGPIRNETTTRTPVNTSPYQAGPASATLNLSGHGSWYEAGPVSVTLGLSGHGSWYEAGPVTATFGLSGTGSWINPEANPDRTIRPAQPRPPR